MKRRVYKPKSWVTNVHKYFGYGICLARILMVWFLRCRTAGGALVNNYTWNNLCIFK